MRLLSYRRRPLASEVRIADCGLRIGDGDALRGGEGGIRGSE